MTSQEYADILKNKLWIKRRNVIVKLDNNKCVNCNSSYNLQVHHLYYEFGKLPWQYPNKALVTLCGNCHLQEHATKDNSLYIKKNSKKLSFFKFFDRNFKKSEKYKLNLPELGNKHLRKILENFNIDYKSGSIPATSTLTKNGRVISCDFYLPKILSRRCIIIQFKRKNRSIYSGKIKMFCNNHHATLLELNLNNCTDVSSMRKKIYFLLKENNII